MDQNDRQAIDRLFDRLVQAEPELPARDPDAESLIDDRLARHPGAAYYMAQTVVVQEQALEAAQARIEALEAEAARAPASGGLLGALFGGGRQQQPLRAQPAPNSPAPAAGPTGQRAGSGFLGGAAQTAMGVAGGVLLANAIGGMFAPDAAEAAEGAPEGGGEDPAAMDDAGGFGDFEL